MNPEPVQAGFLNDNEMEALTRPHRRLALQLGKARQKPRNITGRDAVFRHLLALARGKRRDQPGLSAQFQRNKNRAKLDMDSGRVQVIM